MELDEFMAKVNELKVNVLRNTKSTFRNIKKSESVEADDIIRMSWRTGGVSGGSCYGGSTYYPVECEPEPDFDDLDAILMAICPKMSFLEYKALSGAIIEVDSEHQSEYYGNSTTYATKSVRIGSLFDQLKKMGLT
jgi:hypothetical protein